MKKLRLIEMILTFILLSSFSSCATKQFADESNYDPMETKIAESANATLNNIPSNIDLNNCLIVLNETVVPQKLGEYIGTIDELTLSYIGPDMKQKRFSLVNGYLGEYLSDTNKEKKIIIKVAKLKDSEDYGLILNDMQTKINQDANNAQNNETYGGAKYFVWSQDNEKSIYKYLYLKDNNLVTFAFFGLSLSESDSFVNLWSDTVCNQK